MHIYTPVQSFQLLFSACGHLAVCCLQAMYTTNLKTGLTEDQAKWLQEKYGKNMLCPPQGKKKVTLLMEYMFTGFPILLWIGVILCFTGYTITALQYPKVPLEQIYLGTVLTLVIIITGLFGFAQEVSNQSILEGFKKLVPSWVTVIRNNVSSVRQVETLVPGDIIYLKSGDKIPADIRILECSSLKVDNSSITGESEALLRSTVCTDDNPLETANMAFFGTMVVDGTGKGIVIATGDNTLIGHIAGLTSGLQPLTSPIKIEIKKFVRVITILSTIISLIVFAVAMALGHSFIDSFIYFIGITVAQVPEGLNVTLTASLTLTAKRMSHKKCLVKQLHAMESLGRTSVICTDKTGTLTMNKMTVSHMYYQNVIVDVLTRFPKSAHNSQFILLCRVAILCNRAYFLSDEGSVDKRKAHGDASEVALLRFMEKNIGLVEEFRSEHRRLFEIPFSSTTKYQISVHAVPYQSQVLLVMKGAPEQVLNHCSRALVGDKEVKLDQPLLRKLNKAILELGSMGERVMGFADRDMPKDYNENFEFAIDLKGEPNFAIVGLRFLGFISLIDPPKVDVVKAVETCKRAGIRVIMVTGDHPVTAMAIAKKVGIISPHNETTYDLAHRRGVALNELDPEEINECKAAVITGNDLRELFPHELDTIVELYEEIVFSRTSPQQKLQIVESFQRCGYIVSVTGDGVNDSPALKKADTGIAMGISGSDVSKEAADIILLDDNFSSIVVGIEEGRLIYDNLKKSIAYICTSNVAEVVPFILMLIIGIPPCLGVIAILLIDVGTDLWPGISLAYEEPESDIMKRPPRDPDTESIIDRQLMCFVFLNIGFLQAVAGLNCYFYVMSQYGFLPARLLWLNEEWLSDSNDLMDSYGNEWTRDERKVLEKKACSAYFLAIVVTQVADCIICKTRRLSVFQHGCGNLPMFWGILFALFVAAFVVYCPYINTLCQLEPVSIYVVLPAIPYAILIVTFDEFRKYFIRKYPNGWASRELYY